MTPSPVGAMSVSGLDKRISGERGEDAEGAAPLLRDAHVFVMKM